MSLESVVLEHVPPSYKVYLALFRNVQNAGFLHQQLLARNADFEYAFIDASMIADAYRRFGVSPSTSDLFVVKITFPNESNPVPASSESISQHLRDNVQGDAVPATDEIIEGITDVRTVRKNYKLNGLAWLDGVKDEVVKRKEIERLVLGGMALRGV
ncbi:hypothetical protein TARUN_3913 [Trichoderma arundinaceum]|uniref:EKC/KEOPS complex subunit CGI121 n=1 Tax=Trichoderma arundinaceum TaxID=490622 RepID=A0A395NQM3_TRIAR|nr:hypothetical protein TARUN_3913 [Trichoderma arundinaceum]